MFQNLRHSNTCNQVKSCTKHGRLDKSQRKLTVAFIFKSFSLRAIRAHVIDRTIWTNQFHKSKESTHLICLVPKRPIWALFALHDTNFIQYMYFKKNYHAETSKYNNKVKFAGNELIYYNISQPKRNNELEKGPNFFKGGFLKVQMSINPRMFCSFELFFQFY